MFCCPLWLKDSGQFLSTQQHHCWLWLKPTKCVNNSQWFLQYKHHFHITKRHLLYDVSYCFIRCPVNSGLSTSYT